MTTLVVPRRSCRLLLTLVLLLGGYALDLTASPVNAQTPSPWWHLSSGSRPSRLQRGESGEVVVIATNLGDADVDAAKSPVQLTDTLPAGLRATSIRGVAGSQGGGGLIRGPVECQQPAGPCEYRGTLPPYDQIELRIAVEVEESFTSGAANGVSVSGGEAPSRSSSRALVVGDPSFGLEEYRITPEEEGGQPDTQAGSHPFQLTTTVTIEQGPDTTPASPYPSVEPVGLPKDVNFDLPPGLIGNPTPFPQCTITQFLTVVAGQVDSNLCPSQTVLGVATVSIQNTGKKEVEGKEGTLETLTVPVFNLEPGAREPARFGFSVIGTPVFIDPSVRTGGDYGITVSAHNITEGVGFLRSEVTFWGVPGDSRHDAQRGWGCLEAAREAPNQAFPCQTLEEQAPPPLLALPTSCSGQPLRSTVEADSWAEPHTSLTFSPTEAMVTLDGCNRLPFEPSIAVTPERTSASTPTGLDVDVHVPQESILNGSGLAESAVKDVTVALPAGVQVDPSSGDGLEACAEGLVGFEGFRELGSLPGTQTALFTPALPEPLQPGVNFCPNAAKVANAEIISPLLPASQHLRGAVYLATQNANPFGSLIALYIVAEDPVSGVLAKLAGEARLCEGEGEVLEGVRCQAAGQLISTFKGTPQLAFEDAKLEFFGGERAPLATPAHCGPYRTTATFTPWSGGQPVESSSTFDVTSGPGGSPCPGASLPFSPSLASGSIDNDAGAFSALTTTIGREDGQQNMQAVTLHYPPGLSGMLSNVKLCGEPQANEGLCGPESQIGETTVSAGVGSDPVTVKGGKVYITGPYNGTGACTVGTPGCAPFGLSIVSPVKAGPFDLEHDTSNPNQDPACDCVVVRAKIEVDPSTAALTVATDQTGPHAIPRLIDGIPVQIKKVNVLVGAGENFTFNPTNCSRMEITGSLDAYEGASEPVGEPFEAADCASLKFAPAFTATTSGKTSKADGASLSVRVTYPSAPQGTYANIRQVKVELPTQLPSRLSTLQKACTQAQFRADPGGCPPASVVGHAKALVPNIPVPLEGPAYFVSNGGEAFPNLIMVLQGYGVTIELVGDTFISRAGITSSTFKTVPDNPVTSFEVTLPEGPYSALAANQDLCKPVETVTVEKKVMTTVHGRKRTVTRKVTETKATSLQMPVEIVGQNGAEVRQDTKIAVTECPKSIKQTKLGLARKKK